MEQETETGRTDPWTLVLERHFGEPEGEVSPKRDGLSLSVPWVVAACVAAVLLLAGVSVLGALTFVNYQRADENRERADAWRDRSEALQELVATRTKDLNRQTARLNVASNRLRSARTSIKRSEQDVAALETRQRELAAEKAAVEDERGQLEVERNLLGEAAVEVGECNSALIDVFNGIDPFDGSVPPALVDRADAECTEADDVVAGLASVAP